MEKEASLQLPVNYINKQPCICLRPKKKILCTLCNYSMVGRTAQQCPRHLKTSFLNDLNHCPRCRSTQYLKEVDN